MVKTPSTNFQKLFYLFLLDKENCQLTYLHLISVNLPGVF